MSTRWYSPYAWAISVGCAAVYAQALASPYSDINAAAANGEVKVIPLRGQVSMLDGSGGEITVLSTPQGYFMVDAGIAVSKAKIQNALKTLGPGPIRYVVNTHWHWDHTDGDSWVRATGANIVATGGTIKHLTQTLRVDEWEHTFTPLPAAGRPNITIAKSKDFAFGGETIQVRAYSPAHTDGDVSVYFPRENVLATGDTWWNGLYPFIDYKAGGGINGMIAAANENLARVNENTIVVPGHGPAGGRSALQEYRDMLVAIRNRVAALKAQGRSADQAVAAKPTAAYDKKWGNAVISPELFTRLVYRGV